MVEHRVTLFRIGAFLLFFSIALLFAAAFCFLAVGEYLFFWIFILCAGCLMVACGLFLQESRRTNRFIDLYNKGSGLEPLKTIKLPVSKEISALFENMERDNPSDKLWEDNRRQAQYLALQNQINPHFLYNTLEAIRSEALIGGLTNVAQMSETLARFFRYTISNTSGLVMLENELRNVEDYFSIQKFRFGDRVNLDIQIPADNPVLSYHLPKLILQPIVENAIIHGLEEKVKGGTITISARYTAKILSIFITDDGVGMDSDELVAINRRLNDHSPRKEGEGKKGGIAIQNVNDRLQLLFGPQYGLAYYSVRGIGTKVEIRLPMDGGPGI
ncbi:MAG: sensor histidine kinase [Sphaerochaetaceae bacterium]|jgi:two-component system sensor histidine kinase YesM